MILEHCPQTPPQVKDKQENQTKASVDTHCSPGTCSPLVSTKHMGPARVDAPRAIVCVLEGVLS
jgi:hypothetical protein